MTSIDGGKADVQLELTKVDWHALAATDFQPPAGYTQIERPMPAAKP
jgi:hypothetical protein